MAIPAPIISKKMNPPAPPLPLPELRPRPEPLPPPPPWPPRAKAGVVMVSSASVNSALRLISFLSMLAPCLISGLLTVPTPGAGLNAFEPSRSWCVPRMSRRAITFC